MFVPKKVLMFGKKIHIVKHTNVLTEQLVGRNVAATKSTYASPVILNNYD